MSVAGVVLDDRGRALLVQRRDNGHWEPPGGVLELEETVHDGLRREVREETGLEVEPGSLTGVYKNMTRGIVALVFRCQVTGGRLVETGEAKDFRWATVDELDELMDEAFAIRIRDGLRDGAEPAVREHDGVRVL
ncbi:NUDIX hydrolase [Spirillospora sp. CA-255316]